MKHKNTLVDFIHTFYKENSKVTEAECVCRLQFEKIGLNNNKVYNIIKDRFPFINQNCKFVVTGKSILKDGESYNETLGKHLAETRAQFKAYYIAERVFEMIKNDMVETIRMINMAKGNCVKNMVNNIEHKNDLINSINE